MIDLSGWQLFEGLIGRCLAIFTGQTSFFEHNLNPFPTAEKRKKDQTRKTYRAPNSESDSIFYECILCFLPSHHSHILLGINRQLLFRREKSITGKRRPGQRPTACPCQFQFVTARIFIWLLARPREPLCALIERMNANHVGKVVAHSSYTGRPPSHFFLRVFFFLHYAIFGTRSLLLCESLSLSLWFLWKRCFCYCMRMIRFLLGIIMWASSSRRPNFRVCKSIFVQTFFVRKKRVSRENLAFR